MNSRPSALLWRTFAVALALPSAHAAAPQSSAPVTRESLFGAGGVTLATWLISATFQHVTGRSSKYVSLVVALGVALLVQFLTDASSLGWVLLLGLLNGCQAYLTAAGVATLAGATTGRRPKGGSGTLTVRPRYGFFDSWF